MLFYVSRFLSILILKTVFRLKVYGQENIPKTGGFILASNHVSYIDPLAVGSACSRPVNFMARHDLFCVPVLGWWMSHVHAFPVKRNSADISALKEAIRRLRDGKGLVLFPEGSRGFEGRLYEPQAGIGFIAEKSNVPVVPAFISGSERALPKGAKFIRPHKITVRFGKQITLGRRLPYQEIAELIMANIKDLSC